MVGKFGAQSAYTNPCLSRYPYQLLERRKQDEVMMKLIESTSAVAYSLGQIETVFTSA